MLYTDKDKGRRAEAKNSSGWSQEDDITRVCAQVPMRGARIHIVVASLKQGNSSRDACHTDSWCIGIVSRHRECLGMSN